MRLTAVSRTSVPKELTNFDINTFLQAFLLELVGEIFSGLLNMAKKESEKKSDNLSDNDTKVIYYISGYIVCDMAKSRAKFTEKVN